MISKEELIKTENSFKEYVETSTDNSYVINRYESYYKYLLDRIGEPQGDEVYKLLHSQVFNLIYSFILWLGRRNIKAKDVSKNWNKKLVARVGNYCNDIKEKNRFSIDESQAFKIREHYVLQDLLDSRDLETVTYCFTILQQTLGHNFIASLIQMLQDNGHSKHMNEMNKGVSLRPGFNGKTIADDGNKYWHQDAKELITYDECTERGLGHHLLCYPIGHEWQNLPVGFKETDPSKVQTDFNNETKEFIDTVFVTEETLAD